MNFFLYNEEEFEFQKYAVEIYKSTSVNGLLRKLKLAMLSVLPMQLKLRQKGKDL